MTKLKAPLLSLKAQGSLGDTLTIRNPPKLHIAGLPPTHPDARTLPQLYQRWTFFDAKEYWKSLSPSAKATYRTLGAPNARTAYQECVARYLINPPDHALWLRLDEPTGFLAHDFSGKHNDTQIWQAIPTTGPIDLARSFDAIDDHLTTPHNPTLNLGTGNWTVTCWLAFHDWTGLLEKWHEPTWHGFIIHVGNIPSPKLRLFIGDGARQSADMPFLSNPMDDLYHHIALVTYHADHAELYLDGAYQASGDISLITGSINNTANLLFRMLISPGTTNADDIHLYTRALTREHIYHLSQRRF